MLYKIPVPFSVPEQQTNPNTDHGYRIILGQRDAEPLPLWYTERFSEQPHYAVQKQKESTQLTGLQRPITPHNPHQNQQQDHAL